MDKNQVQPMRLNIFLTDLRQSHKFAVYILEKRLHDKKSELSKLIHQAFNTSLIVSYSRPFKLSNEFPGQIKSSLKQWIGEVLKSEGEAELHERTIDKRDTVYGHSDARSHLFEGFDYSSKRLKLMKYPYAPLNKSETEQLKIMIEKWIAHLKKEQSKAKASLTAHS